MIYLPTTGTDFPLLSGQNHLLDAERETLTEKVLLAVSEAQRQVEADNSQVEVGVVAGFVYPRKGHESVDLLGGHRNPAYGSPGDDIIVQVTYRIPRYNEAWELFNTVDADLRHAEAVAAHEQAVRQFEEAQANLARAQAALPGTP